MFATRVFLLGVELVKDRTRKGPVGKGPVGVGPASYHCRQSEQPAAQPEGRLRFRPSRCKALNSRTSCMPPLDAIVLVVDEKSHFQAPERAPRYRKLTNGRALSAAVTTTSATAPGRGREAAAAGSGLFAIPPQYGINSHCNP